MQPASPAFGPNSAAPAPQKPSATLADVRRLLAEDHALEALATLATAAIAGPSAAIDAGLLRARVLLACEHFDATFDAIGAVHARTDRRELQSAELSILKARFLRRSSSMTNEPLELAMSAATLCERVGTAEALDLATEARVEAARVFARKRVRELADEQLARAAAYKRDGGAVAVARMCAEGDVLVEFDERDAALERFRAARALGPVGERLGRGGEARVGMLMGKFDEAHAHLASLGMLRTGEAALRRLRSSMFVAQQRWAEAVASYDDILRVHQGSSIAPRDKYERACALYRAGWIPQAKAGFDELASTVDEKAPFADLGKLARRHARLLARPDVAQRGWRRLVAFPTVAQLRSHCGPAACELYLRFFGVPASQIEVARAIKQANGGTSVWRMRRFLEQAGLHVRRVEAELPLVKRLIDAQIPVIMEEEYSTTGHVAVAIGYDDVRDVLEVQDPMTHEVRETPYEDLAKLRDLSNHGALVAVPPQDWQRMQALDRAGAVECKYMALVDDAWAALDAGKPDEGDRLVEQSLAVRRDYELAWFYKFGRASDALEKARTPENKLALFKIVSEITALWPDDEWPEQFRGQALLADDRVSEALVAFTRARDRDDGDARNWAMMGVCQLVLGRDDDAYESLRQALRRDPSNLTANERLAGLAMERDELALAANLNEVARRRAPERAINHDVHGRILARRGLHAEAVAAFDRALAIDKRRPYAALERAKSLAATGKVDDAVGALETTCKELPEEAWLRVETARFALERGRPERAASLAEAELAKDEKNGAALAVLGAAKAARGDRMEGTILLRKALALRPTDAWIYTQMGNQLTSAGEHALAVEAYATALGLSRDDPQREYDLGVALAAAGHTRDAARSLSRAATRGKLPEAALVKVGEVVVDAGQPVRPLLEKVVAEHPDDLGSLRAFARTMLELCWAPQIAAPIVARIDRIAPDDPFALAQRGGFLFDKGLESEAEGERLLLEAVKKAPEREYPRTVLAERLAQRGRHEQALGLLEPCKLRHLVVKGRVRSLLALGRDADAEAQIRAFDDKWGKPGAPSYGAMTLRYDVARRRWDFKACLELAEALARDSDESEDDGKLDAWETAKFECLARLGEHERALRFGERQALDARSMGLLAEVAHVAGAPALAQTFADRVLRLNASQAQGLFVSGRTAELAGDAARAANLYGQAIKGDPEWYLPHLAVARLALAGGDVQLASSAAEAAVKAAHVTVEPFGVRAQVKLMLGDRGGAAADLDRAWKMARPELRERAYFDSWATRAQVLGDLRAADQLLAHYVASPAVSPSDRARVQRLRALG